MKSCQNPLFFVIHECPTGWLADATTASQLQAMIHDYIGSEHESLSTTYFFRISIKQHDSLSTPPVCSSRPINIYKPFIRMTVIKLSTILHHVATRSVPGDHRCWVVKCNRLPTNMSRCSPGGGWFTGHRDEYWRVLEMFHENHPYQQYQGEKPYSTLVKNWWLLCWLCYYCLDIILVL